MTDYWSSELGEILYEWHTALGPVGEMWALEKLAVYLDETHTCEAIAFHGSRNPDAAHFGPDEQCEELALPGSRYCDKHAQAEGPDPDAAYEAAREWAIEGSDPWASAGEEG